MLNLINLGTSMSFVKYATMLFGPSPKEGKAKTDLWATVAAMAMGFTSLLTGLFAEGLTEFLFNFEVHVVVEEYVQKGYVYVLMLIAGIAFYNGIIKHGGLITRIGHIELTFNGIITSMVGYLIVLIAFLSLVL